MTRAPGVERPRSIVLGIRIGACVLVAVVWALLAARNERLRAEAVAMIQRARLTREIQVYRVAAIEGQSLLPEAGTGDPVWWKERLTREIARHQLALVRFEAKPEPPPLGSYPVVRREMVIAGAFEAALRFIGWLETAPPRARIERFTLEPSPPGEVRLSLAVLLPGARREAR